MCGFFSMIFTTGTILLILSLTIAKSPWEISSLLVYFSSWFRYPIQLGRRSSADESYVAGEEAIAGSCLESPELRDEWARRKRQLQQICRHSRPKNRLPTIYENPKKLQVSLNKDNYHAYLFEQWT